MSEKNEAKKPGVVSTLLSIVQILLILALTAVALLSFGTRIPVLARFGFNFFGVTSGSMEPAIPTGSLVYAGKYKLEDLKKGDIITYRKTNPENGQSSVVTHRLQNVDKKEEKQQIEENGKKSEKTVITYTFKTQGDANNAPDDYTLSPGEIIGLYQWHLPKLGYVSLFAQRPEGFILLVILPAVILIAWEIISLFQYFTKRSRAQSESEINRLKAELELHKKDDA